MKYVIAERSKVLSYGVNAVGHRQKGTQIVVNEKELDQVPGDTLTKKAGYEHLQRTKQYHRKASS